MITAVIDTNVFVSALIAGGTPFAAIETTRQGESRLLVTTEIVTEIERVLQRPKFAPYFQKRETQPIMFIHNYTSFARYVTPVKVTDCPIKDEKNLMFIECAVGGEADYIVSGDKHLLTLGAYQGIKIVTPAQFLEILVLPTDAENESS